MTFLPKVLNLRKMVDQADSADQEQTLTLEALATEAGVGYLGAVVAQLLLSHRTCTLVVHDDGAITYVNPQNVYMPSELAQPPAGHVPVMVRPILKRAAPQYVLQREDGSFWEVEYVHPSELEDEDKDETER